MDKTNSIHKMEFYSAIKRIISNNFKRSHNYFVELKKQSKGVTYYRFHVHNILEVTVHNILEENYNDRE